MDGKTHLIISVWDYPYVHSDEFRSTNKNKRGQWVPKNRDYKFGNDLFLPVLYPEKDADFNVQIWLTLLGFEIEDKLENMGEFSAQYPKWDAVKVGAWVKEVELFKDQPHAVDLKNGTIVEFEFE